MGEYGQGLREPHENESVLREHSLGCHTGFFCSLQLFGVPHHGSDGRINPNPREYICIPSHRILKSRLKG